MSMAALSDGNTEGHAEFGYLFYILRSSTHTTVPLGSLFHMKPTLPFGTGGGRQKKDTFKPVGSSTALI